MKLSKLLEDMVPEILPQQKTKTVTIQAKEVPLYDMNLEQAAYKNFQAKFKAFNSKTDSGAQGIAFYNGKVPVAFFIKV